MKKPVKRRAQSLKPVHRRTVSGGGLLGFVLSDVDPDTGKHPRRRFWYRVEYRRCSKPGCHCMRSDIPESWHGPYTYLVWWSRRKHRALSKYLGRGDLTPSLIPRESGDYSEASA